MVRKTRIWKENDIWSRQDTNGFVTAARAATDGLIYNAEQFGFSWNFRSAKAERSRRREGRGRETRERQGEGPTEAEICQRRMSALANNIDSLIARGKYVSVDAERVFKKLTAIYCIVTLINGVYFLVWSYFASYNGVNFVGYKGYKSRAWEPDPVAEVTERNGLFYKGGLVYTKVYYSSATYGLQRTFLIAQWYGILVSLSQFAACSSCERTSEKKTSRTHVLVRGGPDWVLLIFAKPNVQSSCKQ